MKGEAAMNFCTAKNMNNAGSMIASARSYYSYFTVCYADRRFAVYISSDRCDRSEWVF